MNAPPASSIPGRDLLRRAPQLYRQETGQSPGLWALVAALSFILQIIFRRNFAPGEFGTLNTALGLIGLVAMPMTALDFALASYGNSSRAPVERVAALRAASLLVAETFAWAWGLLVLALLFLLLPLLDLPRYPLQLFTLLNAAVAIGTALSWSLCRRKEQIRLWTWLLVAAVILRVLIALVLAPGEPWAESGLAIFLFAGFITLTPALRQSAVDFATWVNACRIALDRDFLLHFGATASVLVSLYLFSSADRIVAQGWFGGATDNNLGLVNWRQFDSYQAAGLLGRALLWGTQPLLLLAFAERSRLEHTRTATLQFLWLYLGTLLAGAVLLILLAAPLSRLFCGPDFTGTAALTTHFAIAMVPIGLLHLLGFFALASRRFPECYILGGCGLVYFLVLDLVGRQPELMIAYMFGGALVAAMVVLFVGVVRWGRLQP